MALQLQNTDNKKWKTYKPGAGLVGGFMENPTLDAGFYASKGVRARIVSAHPLVPERICRYPGRTGAMEFFEYWPTKDFMVKKHNTKSKVPHISYEDISMNPYGILLQDPYVTFDICDKIGLATGRDTDDMERLEAMYDIALLRASKFSGHMLVTEREIESQFARLPYSKGFFNGVHNAIGSGYKHGQYYSHHMYSSAGTTIVEYFDIYGKAQPLLPSTIREIDDQILDPEQLNAIQMAISNNTCCITGAAGTGKTTIIRAIKMAFNGKVTLCAFSGKAAKRMEEATGVPATTIHRLLKFDGNRFNVDELNPIEDTRAVIIDEASMVPSDLLAKVISALAPTTKLILVGDFNQLEPIDPGQPFRDIIINKLAPIATLKKIWRQEGDLCRNALGILDGKFEKTESRHWHYTEAQSSGEVVGSIEGILEELHNKGVDIEKDVQIICPMKMEAKMGTDYLNPIIRKKFHKLKYGTIPTGKKFITGDKVIQTKNDYSINVFNGTMGRFKRWPTVTFEGKDVLLSPTQVWALQYAYLITIHKSQGSEFSHVIVICHDLHKNMLNRNLLYTAVTRARHNCYIIGSDFGIMKAVDTMGRFNRRTWIQYDLNLL